MRYLIITKSYQFSFVDKLTKENLDKHKKGVIEIIDIQEKQFLVEKETWQKIPEKNQ